MTGYIYVYILGPTLLGFVGPNMMVVAGVGFQREIPLPLGLEDKAVHCLLRGQWESLQTKPHEWLDRFPRVMYTTGSRVAGSGDLDRVGYLSHNKSSLCVVVTNPKKPVNPISLLGILWPYQG